MCWEEAGQADVKKRRKWCWTLKPELVPVSRTLLPCHVSKGTTIRDGPASHEDEDRELRLYRQLRMTEIDLIKAFGKTLFPDFPQTLSCLLNPFCTPADSVSLTSQRAAWNAYAAPDRPAQYVQARLCFSTTQGLINFIHSISPNEWLRERKAADLESKK